MNNFKSKILKFIGLIIFIPLIFSSCEGMFEGIYDEPLLQENEEKPQTVYGFTAYDENTHKGTMYLNISDYDKWLYISFKDRKFDTIYIPQTLTQDWDGISGIHYQYVQGSNFSLDSIVKTDTQKDPAHWDIALHRYEGKVNGGAIQTNYSSLDELPPTSENFDNANYTTDEWIDTLVMTDISGMMNYYIGYQNIKCNKVLSNWLSMNISTPPPSYHPSNKVYILRLRNNTKVALRFDNYMSQNGTKGFATISFIYPY